VILVTGANGLTGGELVRRLSAQRVPVRALVRNAARAPGLSSLPGVEVVTGDMARPETLTASLRGVSRAMLISSSDPAMLDVQSSFITAARSAGVAHVVKLSGIIPDRDSPFRFARMHGEIERRLEDSGMAFTHLRAGEFMHAYFRQVPSIVARGVLALPMEDAKIASIDIGDIAAVAAAVLSGSGHEGKTHPITGPAAIGMAEVAEKLSAVVGKRVAYVNVSPEDAKRAQLAAGLPPLWPTRWPSSSQSGAREESHRFHRSFRRSLAGARPVSRSLPPATRRSSEGSSRHRGFESQRGFV
jgi:uncharacterized protein YbjT (DUF2867 family)